jgi:hypothetical protein
MKKKDLHKTELPAWDQYVNKSSEEVLKSIYETAMGNSKTIRGWYWHSIKTKRIWSLVLRFAAFFLLVLGILLPVVSGLSDSKDWRLVIAQSGIIALAAAGLLQAGDKIFGMSSGWLRYISTVTSMENATHKFEIDWSNYIIGKNGNLTDLDLRTLYEYAKQLENDLDKMKTDETEKWISEFNSGLALLNEMIKTQKEAADKAVATAQATISSAKPGAIEISFAYQNNIVPIKIKIDDENEFDFSGLSWSRVNMDPGIHKVTVSSTVNNIPAISRTFNITPGGIEKLSIQLYK